MIFVSYQDLDGFKRRSVKHSSGEFAGRHNLREMDTVKQMESIEAGFIGKRLMNKGLADGVDG